MARAPPSRPGPGSAVDEFEPGPIRGGRLLGHARRYFFELARLNKAPIGIEAVTRIDALFAIERDINGAVPADRQRVRQERSKPLVDDCAE